MSSNLTDIGSERAVLAGLLRYGTEAYVEISDIIDHQTFGNTNNQVLYKCLSRVIEGGAEVDLPSILSAAEQLNFSDIINSKQELEYIKSLFDFPIKVENVPRFASQIKKFEIARKIKSLVSKISKDADKVDGSESVDQIMAMVETPIMDFLREDDGGERPERIGEGADDYIEFLKDNKCDLVGISTGFPRFDMSIGGGLRRKCVDLVSARPKVGKSVFADNVALNVASNGVPVLMLDTEMSKEDHLNRIIANLSGIPINEIATGKFSDDDEKLEKVSEAVEHIESIPYSYTSVAGKPFEQILNIIKRWIMQEVGTDEYGRTNECVVIYDYLKLMTSNSITHNVQEYQALGFQITSLHNLCVKYDFPCLSFVQLNRDGITSETTATVSGSDRLIWLCTSFSIFKLKSAEELAEDGVKAGNRKLVPIVSRHGAGLSDGDYINMNMVGEHAKLLELKTRNEFNNQPSGDTGLISQEALENIADDGLEEG
jgi:replicative DNA helicase|tara:strand:- start:5325 stop:6785 length:1461 start_codon:yes stop_codon:yes gene_type:complete